jgi:hypothetical protein
MQCVPFSSLSVPRNSPSSLSRLHHLCPAASAYPRLRVHPSTVTCVVALSQGTAREENFGDSESLSLNLTVDNGAVLNF